MPTINLNKHNEQWNRLKIWTTKLTQFMNNQFEQNHEQSISTEMSIWTEILTVILKQCYQKLVRKTNIINQFGENYQKSFLNI